MTYVDLLTYLTDVQKIEKEELAELLAIPKKKIDGVLCGQVPLKKRWLRNLSLYTGIPKDAILAGSFVLNIPDGEPAPVVKDAYVPEAIREANTQRLNTYAKKRYNLFYGDTYFPPLFVLVSAVCLVVLVGMVFLLRVLAVADLVKVMLMGILPVIMSFSVMRASIKFAKKGVLADEKPFKFYVVLAVVQALLTTIVAIAFEWQTAVALAATIGAVLPLIYLVFVQGNNSKVACIKTLVLAIALALLCLCVVFCFFTGEKLDAIESAEQIASSIIVFTCGWISCLASLGSVFVSYCFFRKRNGVSKHFGAVIKNPAFKKNRIVKSILSIILAGVIVFVSIYTLPVFVINKIVLNVVKDANKAQIIYCEYDKTDITFSAEEKTKLVEEKNYTIKIPDTMVKSEEYNNYKDSAASISMMIRDEYIDFGDIFDDTSNAMGTTDGEKFSKIKETIKKEYGFFPKTEHEYYKLQQIISEDTISPFDRDLNTATTMFKMMETAVSTLDTTIYLYENSEKVLCVKESFFEKENGEKVYTYDISGNARGDYSKYCDFLIMFIDTKADKDTPFKIINSIEFK